MNGRREGLGLALVSLVAVKSPGIKGTVAGNLEIESTERRLIRIRELIDGNLLSN